MFTEPPILDSPLVLPPAMRTMPPSPLLAPTVRPMLPAEEASPVAMLASPESPPVAEPEASETVPLAPANTPFSLDNIKFPEADSEAPLDMRMDPPRASFELLAPAFIPTEEPSAEIELPPIIESAPAFPLFEDPVMISRLPDD
jgi:hypothetical protein